MRFIFLFIFLSGVFKVIAQKEHIIIKDSGFVFDLAPFNECHASTLVDLGNGKVMCSWFGGTHERHPDVAIWTSVYDGIAWSKPQEVANGIVNDTLRFPCWNPVLYRNHQNILYLFYKIGPSPAEWQGVYKFSKDKGKIWSSETKMPDNFLGPIKNKPIELDGCILSPTSTESIDGTRWKSFIEISTPDFKKIKQVPIDTAAHIKVIQPTLLAHSPKKVQALLRSDQNKILQSWSYDRGNTWSTITPTTLMNPNSAIDAIALKNKFMLVYNPSLSGKDWWAGRAKLNIAISADGLSWQDILVLEDKEAGEFSYPAIIKTQDGKIFISYTYNRKKIKYIILEIK